MEDSAAFGQISALRDEIDRISAQLRPGSFNRISPQKEKGDLAVWGSKKSLRLPLGDNGQVLMVDPVADGGMKWGTVSAQFVVQFATGGPSDLSWNNMPLAEAFLFGDSNHVSKADLTGYTQARLIANQQAVGVNGALLELQYRTAFSATASAYSPIGTSVVTVTLPAAGSLPDVLDSGWIDLTDDAKADVFLAVVGSGGDGASSPRFGTIYAVFK